MASTYKELTDAGEILRLRQVGLCYIWADSGEWALGRGVPDLGGVMHYMRDGGRYAILAEEDDNDG